MQNEVPYSEAIRSKYPEQVVVGIARDASGKCNPITLGWTMIVSSKPPMMAVALGKGKHSVDAFRHARQFVVAFPSDKQVDEVMLFASSSGRDVDKFEVAGTLAEPAGEIDGAIMTDAVANFECTLVSEHEAGDHVIFIGEIVRSHVNPDMPNRLYSIGPGHTLGGLGRAT